jgi:protein OS-9
MAFLKTSSFLLLLLLLCPGPSVQELSEFNYRINFVEEEGWAPFSPEISSPSNNNEEGETIIMTRHDGERFKCFLPALSPETDERDSHAPSPTIEALFTPLRHSCIYRIEAWWTYEICYSKSVSQFHQQGSERVAFSQLGVAQDELPDEDGARRKIYTEEGERMAYFERYTNGTLCDITNKPREVEVEFFCSPSARPAMVYGIRESSTCNYVITVGTSLLCPHPEFRVEDKAEHPITCKHLDNFHRDESSQELDIEPPPLLLQSEGELEEGKGQFMK